MDPLSSRTTLVEQVVDRIVEAAARGTFLPGDRVVEAEVARRLQVSRVPVREALRLLESQGIVENMPYRGMRLMDVSVARLEKVLKVRLALEQLAAEEARLAARKNPGLLGPLVETRNLMEDAARRGDRYELARLDTMFHRQLCALTGNEVLLRTWEPLSLQLTIIFGLSSMQKDLGPIAAEHTDIIEALRTGSAAAVAAVMREHIVDYTRALDHEGFIERLRLSGVEGHAAGESGARARLGG
jgi:DNA-binding GntR family transcriptional regulator